jgi:hypothetical protein
MGKAMAEMKIAIDKAMEKFKELRWAKEKWKSRMHVFMRWAC